VMKKGEQKTNRYKLQTEIPATPTKQTTGTRVNRYTPRCHPERGAAQPTRDLSSVSLPRPSPYFLPTPEILKTHRD
jgi:hypothetical protein